MSERQLFSGVVTAAAAAAASVIEIVLDDTSTASSRYLQRREDLDIPNYSHDKRPFDLLSVSSRHVAEQLTYIDAVGLRDVAVPQFCGGGRSVGFMFPGREGGGNAI